MRINMEKKQKSTEMTDVTRDIFTWKRITNITRILF